MHSQFFWNAEEYFRKLTSQNRLARQLELSFCLASGLQGFEEAIDRMLDAVGFVCLTESSDGKLSTDSSPNARRVKTVFLALRHAENDMEEHNRSIALLAEVFRQFMSHLLRQKNSLHLQGIYIEPDIDFHEISQYTFSGCACIYFHVAYSTAVDLRFNPQEWTAD